MLDARSAHTGTTETTTTGTTERRRLTVVSGPDPHLVRALHAPHVCACSAEAREVRAELASYLLALQAAQGALTQWRADLDALREDLAALADLSPADLDPLDHG